MSNIEGGGRGLRDRPPIDVARRIAGEGRSFADVSSIRKFAIGKDSPAYRGLREAGFLTPSEAAIAARNPMILPLLKELGKRDRSFKTEEVINNLLGRWSLAIRGETMGYSAEIAGQT